MKRSIVLFLLAFLMTIGAAAAVYFLLQKGGIIKMPSIFNRKPAIEEPAEPTPTPAPTPAPAPAPTPAPAPEPTPAPEPAPAPAPAPEPAPTPRPAPALRPLPQSGEKPRSVEHSMALQVTEALKGDNAAAVVDEMVKRGRMSQDAADALKAWAAAHKATSVEEVGTARRPDGAKVTRYRIKSADGGEDMLVDVVTARNGEVTIEAAKATPADKTHVGINTDALTVAEGFMEAVRRGDMTTARSLVTGTEVSDATVAGLCMVFEEGAFSLRTDAPIRSTFENADHAGFLVYIVSKDSPRPGNVGLEMTRTEPGWRVSAVALDALLSSYEASASAEGGRYFPIVKNPRGGDSLALFFGFNEAELTPRSLRQLQIVAELLKQSPGKKLNISGHTDDVGSEAYNQKLSERRADAVKTALVSFGVQAEQITTHGLGKSQPRRHYRPEDSVQQIDYVRGENRRAEIYLDFES
ncbi:MAG: OmpA family protein [Akkermansia sp.]|nr:OmpA family protein [Akkermansia sp.]